MHGSIVKHPVYFQRLNRDIKDLLAHNFNFPSSCLSVVRDESGITLNVCILEGPYRRGHFSFLLDIPINYPFKSVGVWAKHPIWHPNVDLLTGRVFLPLDWSPVLTLHSLALAVQMMLLEPSTDNALNIEASSYYNTDQLSFEQQVQATLQGCRYVGVDFPSVINPTCVFCSKIPECVSYFPNSPADVRHARGEKISASLMEVIPNHSDVKRKKQQHCAVIDGAGDDTPHTAGKLPLSELYSGKRTFPEVENENTTPANVFSSAETQRRFLGTSVSERRVLRDYQGESLKKRSRATHEELSSFDELSIEKDNSVLSRW